MVTPDDAREVKEDSIEKMLDDASAAVRKDDVTTTMITTNLLREELTRS